jgi:hypothetical protein
MFRDGKYKADQVFPFSAWNSEDPEKLWAWMESYEQKTGGRLLAILSAQVATLRAGWTLVAVRVAGSWIAAIGLLLLGWTLSGRG